MFEIKAIKFLGYPVYLTLLVTLFFISGLHINAQIVKRPVILGSNAHAGLVIPVYDAVNYIISEDIFVYNFSVGFPARGKDFWEKLYRYPVSGLGYSFWNLGNSEILGKAHALYGFLNIPILKKAGKFSINYQISLGAAYHTKIFDKYENHLNRAIGSHLNGYVRVGIDSKIRISPRSELITEAGVSHFSNGKTKSPNYGINAGSVSIGLNYHFNNNRNIIEDPEIPPVNKRYVQSLLYSAGYKVYNNMLGKKYFVTSGSYNIDRNLSQKVRAGLGADFFYDGSIREALADIDGNPEKDFDKLIKVGVHASYSIRYKQTLLGFQAGHYLYYKYTVLTPMYFRLSLQYMLSNNLIGSLSVKTHLGIADTLEWGLGYCW